MTLPGMSGIYGLDPAQFGVRIIRPLLVDIGLWSTVAERLVLGTAMQESRLTYLQQVSGPAIGIYQMEPATYDDIRCNFLANQRALRLHVDAWAIGAANAREMEGNLYFATAMCRVLYRRVSDPLPRADDAAGLAAYYKAHYNTPLGKATVDQALPHFQRAIDAFSTGGLS